MTNSLKAFENSENLPSIMSQKRETLGLGMQTEILRFTPNDQELIRVLQMVIIRTQVKKRTRLQ